MKTFVVTFHATVGSIDRTYEAPTAQDCLDLARAHFATWNADHGELEEIVVCPLEGEAFLDGDPNILELYWLPKIPEPEAVLDQQFGPRVDAALERYMDLLNEQTGDTERLPIQLALSATR